MYGLSKYNVQDGYGSYNTVQVKLELNMKTSADVLAWARQHKCGGDISVQGVIKVLVWGDIVGGQVGGT